MREKHRNPRENLEQYFKVIWVDLKNSDCELWKAPADEVWLMEMLRDDYNSSRYGKELQLIARERVGEKDMEFFLEVLSEKNMKKAFRKGKKKLEYSYMRLIDDEYQWMRAKVLRTAGCRFFPREVVIYIEHAQRPEKTRKASGSTKEKILE